VGIEDPIILLVISFLALFTLLAIGFHIAIALAIVGVAGLFLYYGNTGLAGMVPFSILDSFILTAIPLFIFMGEILVKSGASEMIYRGASRLLAWLPGGLFHANIGSCAMFAAISGSSPATAATIGTVAIPALKKRGYDTNITLGSLAAGGTLGILIPPSLNMIIFGVVSEKSIGRLFAGGVIPGLILCGMFMTYIAIRVIRNSKLAPKEASFTLKGVALSFVDLWPLFVLAIVVLGGIFGGFMTPTEAAAVGTVVSLIIAMVLRRFSWGILKSALASSVQTTAMVLFIVVGSVIMASFFSRAGIPHAVSQMIVESDISKWGVLFSIYAIYIFLGCFIDPASILLLTASTVLPIISGLGFDLIWFGVVYVVTAEIGMITPPMGLNLFVIQGLSREDLWKVVIGSIPFFFLMLVCLALLTYFPNIILWLPNLIFGVSG